MALRRHESFNFGGTIFTVHEKIKTMGFGPADHLPGRRGSHLFLTGQYSFSTRFFESRTSL
jgi:hypothetical protein